MEKNEMKNDVCTVVIRRLGGGSKGVVVREARYGRVSEQV